MKQLEEMATEVVIAMLQNAKANLSQRGGDPTPQDVADAFATILKTMKETV